MPKKPGTDALVMYEGKILLILRDDIPTISFPNMWNMPGGGIEEGESPEHALKRELEEEIGIAPQDVTFLEKTDYEGMGEVYRFLVELSEEEYNRVHLGDEGQRLDWFAFDELASISIAPGNKKFFEMITGGLQKIFEAPAKKMCK